MHMSAVSILLESKDGDYVHYTAYEHSAGQALIWHDCLRKRIMANTSTKSTTVSSMSAKLQEDAIPTLYIL